MRRSNFICSKQCRPRQKIAFPKHCPASNLTKWSHNLVHYTHWWPKKALCIESAENQSHCLVCWKYTPKNEFVVCQITASPFDWEVCGRNATRDCESSRKIRPGTQTPSSGNLKLMFSFLKGKLPVEWQSSKWSIPYFEGKTITFLGANRLWTRPYGESL